MLIPNTVKMKDEFLLQALTEFRRLSNMTPRDLTSTSSDLPCCSLSMLCWWNLGALWLMFFPSYSNSSFPTSSVAFMAFLTIQCMTRVPFRGFPTTGIVYPLLLLDVTWSLTLHPYLRQDIFHPVCGQLAVSVTVLFSSPCPYADLIRYQCVPCSFPSPLSSCLPLFLQGLVTYPRLVSVSRSSFISLLIV